MNAIVFDTGPLAAALNASDGRHTECASLLVSMTSRRLLPSPVLTEVCWLLERWPRLEAAFLAEVARGTFELVHLAPVDLERMGELVLRYADLPSWRSRRIGDRCGPTLGSGTRRYSRPPSLQRRPSQAHIDTHPPALTARRGQPALLTPHEI